MHSQRGASCEDWKSAFKPVFHLRIFSREANFSFVFGLSKISLRAKKFASGKPALDIQITANHYTLYYAICYFYCFIRMP
jgi:hypothetical protein